MDGVLDRSVAQAVLAMRIPASIAADRQRQVFDSMLRLSSSISSPNFAEIGRDDVRRMVMLYDDLFFDSQITRLARREGLSFSVSGRLTKTAGKLVTHYQHNGAQQKRRFEIVLSSTLLFQTFNDVHRPVEVTGVLCRNRLEAMQRVVEHELVHLIEMLLWENSSCARRRFQGIAGNVFGHRDYRHDLITQAERAERKYQLRVGDAVAFEFEGITRVGFLNRITRRATVLVPDPAGHRFDDGRRYVRYYVPLERLRRAEAVGS